MENETTSNEIIRKINILDTAKVNVIGKKTSLQITIPNYWKKLFDVESGDLIEIAMLGISQKVIKKKK